MARLPWLIGASAFLLYVLTLNRWVSLYSLGTVARTCGWLWQPELHQPLAFAVLSPFRFLPEPWDPLALNLFNAVCAAIILVLLARSVALLPHDLPHSETLGQEQSPSVLSTPTAWLPPLLAVILCGLQLSFWEHATSASGEMIDLLLLAYVIRCLLEFRLDPAQSWLSRAACVYGAGMANNWALVAFLPVFIAAIMRLKGYGPFRERTFLLRMTLWGMGGLSLYLLLPTIHGLSPHEPVGFWVALKAHLKSQKEILSYLRRPAFRVLAVTSLLPILVLAIRWKSHSVQFGDDTRLGVFLTKSAVHALHALFFLASLWLALDPAFSPRHLELGMPLLSYYYLCALVFGYCAGYFLVFGSRGAVATANSAPQQWWNRIRLGPRLRAPFLAAVLGLGVASALALALVARNVSQMFTTNGPWLHSFARQLYTDLPAGQSVVLSESTAELLLLRAELSAHRNDKAAFLVDAPSLGSAQYHEMMARVFPARWPMQPPTNRLGGVSPGKVLDLVSAFAARERVIQLQPGSGFLYELFNEQSRGSIYYLEHRAANDSRSFTYLPPAERLAGDDEKVWEQRWTNSLQKLAEHTKENPNHPAGLGRAVQRALLLDAEPNATARFVGAAYSKRLNYWGVQQQRLGRAFEADQWFKRAVALNPENLSARINLEYAERCQRGDRTRLNIVSVEHELSDLFTKRKDWRATLSADGPVDEPSFLFRTGRALLAQGGLRQGVEAFARSAALAPDWAAPKLWLAQSYVQLREFAAALEVTDHIQPPNLPPDGAGLARLLDCRATALRGLGRTNDAARCIESFVNQFAKHDEVLLVAAELYALAQQFEAGLALLEELLKREPKRPDLLARKGLAQLQLSRFEDAIATLTSALVLAPRNDEARLCRAVAYLGADQFEAARADYEELLKTTTQSGNALFGLGTIAWRQRDTNLAIGYYQRYLSNGIPGSGQYGLALGRLKELTRE